ncbi:MAG: ABC transporter ATP-binding protein [Pseudomonadota bacterium]|jgi:lipopolysaccharide transport system ATP-binding protein
MNSPMRSDNIAISVQNLTKIYRLFGHPGDRVKQFFSLGFKQYHSEFTALRDVSFDVKKGETVGIIGRNGSGKSTLLQLICGILKPTAGTVQVYGRVSALLELGAGFNPEFTGRENVYFQGALQGFTKEQMEERYDEIAAFADIGEFIDQPVRIYSSGMFVRLAFAVAIHVSPDLLLVDEALAVGDARFQGKCFERIADIRKRGGTILIVTHALEQVAHFCDRAILLDRGKLLADGETASTLSHYLSILGGTAMEPPPTKRPPSAADAGFCRHPAYNPNENRWGDRAATIEGILIIQSGKNNPESLLPGQLVELALTIAFHADISHPIYGLAIKSPAGAIILNTNSRQLLGPDNTPDQHTGDIVQIHFSFQPNFDCGEYLLSFGVVSETGTGITPHDRRYDAISINLAYPQLATGEISMNPQFRLTTTT